jgi:hypothetical protein
MHFGTKSYLKSTHNHTVKHALVVLGGRNGPRQRFWPSDESTHVAKRYFNIIFIVLLTEEKIDDRLWIIF